MSGTNDRSGTPRFCLGQSGRESTPGTRTRSGLPVLGGIFGVQPALWAEMHRKDHRLPFVRVA